MANDQQAAIGVAILTSYVRDDLEAFVAATNDLQGGCPEAIAPLGRVAEAMVKMFAELLGVTVDQALEQIALAIANG